MNKLENLFNKNERMVIGLMSGTSVDGIDAALVRIKGSYTDTKAELLGFENYKMPDGIRERIFALFEDKTSSSKDICHMNFLLGELFAEAAKKIADKCAISLADIDLIGSHGQTIYHIPVPVNDCGYQIRSTLQIGEGAVIADRTGVVTVSDFRVMDVAAGGEGAPLVPYTEYLLYRSETDCIALQNIGGVGNITVIPKGAAEHEVIAFDTGPGNMIIDFMVSFITNGKQSYDVNGEIASQGIVNEQVLSELMQDKYFKILPPKTTGREYFGKRFSKQLLEKCKSLGMSDHDIVATTTMFTAKTIADACEHLIPLPITKLVVGGGGSYNSTLVKMLKAELPKTTVCIQEDLGFSSDAKEAIAFAVLANETISFHPNNTPSATGAYKKKILGKISI
ncbi:anhydro-N-acetylmuramic acid kinase AnmK [Paludicola sp. MB14-C6]|uniref:anhydro-N-acetylmuramic acid kinase AnmK n=1 Tax=Paludihabitans sp. MB14-C6 TaxID=3070656 RepID=UPI0027DE73B6|nr:anhydro-N-acetylmuramic acid kinase AnmK [Paludicola sp. MB14-C6]WMJ22118.1 anhydro-N-acetylmuramic acid kinase AnmK [Paludicola sp. MB14-C6]